MATNNSFPLPELKYEALDTPDISQIKGAMGLSNYNVPSVNPYLDLFNRNSNEQNQTSDSANQEANQETNSDKFKYPNYIPSTNLPQIRSTQNQSNPTPVNNSSNVKSDNSRNSLSRWNSTYKDKKEDWIKDMTTAFRNAGVTNQNMLRALVAQGGLESAWGRSAQGQYNFGNITVGAGKNYGGWSGSYTDGNDKNAYGQSIKQRFRAYNSLDEFAKDKVGLLKSLYDFDENDDIDTFANKLKGGNSGKRHYAEDRQYAQKIVNTYNALKLEKGGNIPRNIKFKSLSSGKGINRILNKIDNTDSLGDITITNPFGFLDSIKDKGKEIKKK